nr:MAG TPA: hypothetical protein [Caudoviricetes sp.]
MYQSLLLDEVYIPNQNSLYNIYYNFHYMLRLCLILLYSVTKYNRPFYFEVY